MITVVKANGEVEPFSEEKLVASMKRAGINSQIEKQVLEKVKDSLYDRIPSSEIYNQLKQYLGQSDKGLGTRYSLKQAIMNLGPTGYPFEDLIAEILKAQGYATLTRQLLSGKCINHEIDVVAKKQNEKIMVEAKFHNLPGVRTDIHVALYTKARFDDLKEKNELTGAFLITNTKLTADAISYANCVGLNVMSWNYPRENNLRDYIESLKIYPVTQLDSLTQGYKKALLEDHKVVCKDLTSECLFKIGVPQNAQRPILDEAESLSNHQAIRAQ